MLSRFAVTLSTLLLVASPAAAEVAEPARPAAEIAERIDDYRFLPRAPGTYRALAGLGDPGASVPDAPWERPQGERALLERLFPGASEGELARWAGDPGQCRTEHALATARERIARFGEAHPYVERWFAVQRAVFSACRRATWEIRPEERSVPRPPVTLPPPLATSDAALASLQRADRAWQAATLLFYRHDPAAGTAFDAIARSASPHGHVARYMLAALPARDLGEWYDEENEAPDPRRPRQAQAAVTAAQAILGDPALADIHPLAQGLIGFVGYHIGDAPSRAAQVDSVLDALEAPLERIAADPVAAERYRRAAEDVGFLHGRFEENEAWWLTGTIPPEMQASRAFAEQARTRPLAAFLLFPMSPFERMPWTRADVSGDTWTLLRRHAEAQAAHEPGSAWRLVLASLATTYDADAWAEVDALVRAAEDAPSDANLAAVAPAFYHQVRTALTFAPPRERRRAFADALSRLESWPWRDSGHYRELVTDSLHFLIAAGRLDEARTLRDRLAPRGADWREAADALLLLAENEDRFAAEATAAPEAALPFLNLASSRRLAALSERYDLPPESRARFARIAWTRLYAAGRPIPLRLDRTMRRLNPEITAHWTSRAGGDRNGRALLLDVLRSPALNILIGDNQRRPGDEADDSWGNAGLIAIDTFEHSDNNWWCAYQPGRHRVRAANALYQAFFAGTDSYEEDPAAAVSAEAPAPLLRSSWLWRAQDQSEQAALAAIESAPQRLAEAAIAWRGEGEAAGQDEALALAVRATRYGCQRQGGHGRWSRAAHTLLHQRFPQSEWTRRTRWWFDCDHFTGGCGVTRTPDSEDWRRWADRLYAGAAR